MASAELIVDLAVRGNRIVVKASDAFRSRFLAEDFFVDYCADVPLSTLGESTLAVPFVLNVAPLVWRSGRRYRIPLLDSALAAALQDVRRAFRATYRDVSWDGELDADRTVDLGALGGSPAIALLFSGGVDSVHSALSHRGLMRHLITVESLLGHWNQQGKGGRAAAREHFRGCAATLGCECHFITTNLRTFISEAKLVGLWPDPRRWMIEVQHAVGLTGLCAPVAASCGIGRLLMASCERDHYGLPGGSHPDIVNAVRWAGVEVRLDGADRTRQEKLRAIAAALGDADDSLDLRPCLRPAPGFENCGACEKCLQTILGLVGERCDPRRFGFKTDLSSALSTLRGHVLAHRLPMPDPGELLQWQDIQRAILVRREEPLGIGLPELRRSADAAWFADLDLATYFRRCHHGPRHAARVLRRRLGLLIDRWPSLGRSLRRALRRS